MGAPVFVALSDSIDKAPGAQQPVSAQRSRRWLLVPLLHALAAAAICSLPHWAALAINRGDYSPFSASPAVSALTFDESHAYAPPVRHLVETGEVAAEVDNYERRRLSAGLPYFPIFLTGVLARALGGVDSAFITADAIFPALLFLLLYFLSAAALSDRGLRLLAAWATLLVPFGLLNAFWLGDDALTAPLEITRTPQPEISFLVLLLAGVLLSQAISGPVRFSKMAAAAIASATVVYCYYFYAIAWGAALVLTMSIGFGWRDRRTWGRTALIGFSTALLSIPFVLATMRGRAEGGQSYLLARMGEQTHRVNAAALILGFIAVFLLWRHGRALFSHFTAAFVLGAMVAGALLGMNVQVISGYETQPWHFWKRLALPLLFLLAVWAGAWAVEHWRLLGAELRRVTCSLAIVVLILNTIARLSYAAYVIAPIERASDPRTEVLRWIDSHLPAERVIGTMDPQLILLIPALTADYTYVPSGLRSLTSDQEIVTRYFQLACLLGWSPAQLAAAAAVPSHLGHSTEVLHVLGLSYTGDQAVYHSLVRAYSRFYERCSAPQWRLDLLLVPNSADLAAAKQRYPEARILHQNALYRVLALQSAE